MKIEDYLAKKVEAGETLTNEMLGFKGVDALKDEMFFEKVLKPQLPKPPKPPEDIAHTKEKYSVRYKTPEPDAEKSVMVEKILHLSKEKKKLKTALKHLRHKPTQMEMKVIIDRNRFKSGKCNNTKVGNELGIDGETALAWIKNLKLSDYAYNPDHIETFHRKKK